MLSHDELSKCAHVVQAETPKPTEGLEYTYIRKPAASHADYKDLAHLWEVSGSQELSQEIFNSDIVLTPEQVYTASAQSLLSRTFLSGTDSGPVKPQVATAVVAVVVDLSAPAQVLQNAVTWLQLVRGKLQTSYDWLDQRGSKLPEQLRLRARKYIGSTHEDKDTIQHLGESSCKAKQYL